MNEEEMDKIIAELAASSGTPKPIQIKVYYDKTLEQITGMAYHPVMISEGAVFAYLFHNIFLSYPEIKKRYPPGILGFAINGIPPKLHTPLFDGDVVELSVSL